MSAETCSVTDETGRCPNPVRARGWCNGHWQRWKKNGEPGPMKLRRIRKGADAICSIADCGRLHMAQGFCAAHYKRARSGHDLDEPIEQQAPKLRLTDHELGHIADTSMTAQEVADLIGLHPATINKRRREMGLGVLRVSDWTDYEIDFLIDNIGKMKTERMAGYLNRSLESVQYEIKRLRGNGIVKKRSSTRLDPWIVAGHPLIAKTCPRCGLFLSSDWFQETFTKNGKRRSWSDVCKKCRVNRANSASESAREKWAAANREYMAKRQAYTLERAENHGKEWTSVDVEVLADPSKTIFEKAIELKRSYAAVNNAHTKHGFAAKREPLGSPHDSAWKLFWEIEDLAVAS